MFSLSFPTEKFSLFTQNSLGCQNIQSCFPPLACVYLTGPCIPKLLKTLFQNFTHTQGKNSSECQDWFHISTQANLQDHISFEISLLTPSLPSANVHLKFRKCHLQTANQFQSSSSSLIYPILRTTSPFSWLSAL